MISIKIYFDKKDLKYAKSSILENYINKIWKKDSVCHWAFGKNLIK
jgi:hypothetical protein